MPVAFWWLSLLGSLCLLTYALFYQKDSVFIFAYAFTWIPYIRNLVLQRRTARQLSCPACAALCQSTARFCPQCGAALSGKTAGPEQAGREA